MQTLNIVKIGGNVIDNKKKLKKFLSDFAKLKGNKILVHGGGKLATEIGNKLGVKSKMVDGRRVTDAETLDVVTMVYAGLINKKIVAQLQANGNNAIGLTGADGNTILARKRKIALIDFGFVGDIEVGGINKEATIRLLKSGFIPVFCALTHDGNGNMLNTNADTISSALSVSLSKKYKVSLTYCFEKLGVLKDLNDDKTLVKKISLNSYPKLISEGVVSGGMIPKLDNAFEAIKNGVKYVYICSAENILGILTKRTQIGTLLSKK